jgi:hypothetical protein
MGISLTEGLTLVVHKIGSLLNFHVRSYTKNTGINPKQREDRNYLIEFFNTAKMNE